MILTPEQIAELDRKRNEIRAAKGLPSLDQFTPAKLPVSRAVAISALYILKVSYGQLMELFKVSQSTVYDAVARHVPTRVRQLRGAGRGRPLIAYELASLYYEKISEAGRHDNAIILAARIQQLADGEDPTE